MVEKQFIKLCSAASVAGVSENCWIVCESQNSIYSKQWHYSFHRAVQRWQPNTRSRNIIARHMVVTKPSQGGQPIHAIRSISKEWFCWVETELRQFNPVGYDQILVCLHFHLAQHESFYLIFVYTVQFTIWWLSMFNYIMSSGYVFFSISCQ